jgi:uncharacterized protein YjbI with pentapeptide repeats
MVSNGIQDLLATSNTLVIVSTSCTDNEPRRKEGAADVSKANLRDANLTRADLTDVNLSGAKGITN